MKKMLSIIITVVILFCSFAMPNANAVHPKEIDTVEITVKNDIDGMRLSEYEKFVKIKTKGLVFDDYNGGLYPVFAIKDGYYSAIEFYEGNGYTLTIYLKADDVNYYVLADSVNKVTVNGEPADYSLRLKKYDSSIDRDYISITCHIDVVKHETLFDKIISFFFELYNSIFNFFTKITQSKQIIRR